MKFIYGFHMPLFFIISGYLWKKKTTVNETCLSGLRRYILPYFILCTINLMKNAIVMWILRKPFPVIKYVIGILYSRGTTEWMPNCSPLWFLTSIFVALILFDLIQRIEKTAVRWGLIFLCGIISSLLSHFEVFKLFWNIDSAWMGIVFIAIGYVARQMNILHWFREQSKLKTILVAGATFSIGAIAIILNPVEQVNFDDNRYGYINLMLFGAIGVCAGLMMLVYRIPWKGIISWYIAWLGQHTIFIMGFDYFMGAISKGLLGKLRLENWLSVFMLKVVLLTIGIIMWTWMVNKIKSKRIRKVLSF